MRVWIIRHYTDPISHYVIWDERYVRDVVTENNRLHPRSEWGYMELYGGDVEEILIEPDDVVI